MTTEIIPLGTASAIPTRERHLSGLALVRQGRVFLFDCGEGTQYQLLRGGIKLMHLDVICITHTHGDHLYGLPGLLSTLALYGREDPLTVVGPAGLEAMLRALPGLSNAWLPFPIQFVELSESLEQATVYETAAYTIEARPIEHRIFAVGYRFQEKDRPGRLYPERAEALGVTDYRHFRQLKAGHPVTLDDGRVVQPEEVIGPPRPGVGFAYVSDTRPCSGGIALAREADLLYHEATFAEELHARAIETGHSTAREAAEVAHAAQARFLLLGHFSARYKDPAPLVEEARTLFQNTEAASELKRYELRAP